MITDDNVIARHTESDISDVGSVVYAVVIKFRKYTDVT